MAPQLHAALQEAFWLAPNKGAGSNAVCKGCTNFLLSYNKLQAQGPCNKLQAQGPCLKPIFCLLSVSSGLTMK